MSKAPPLTQNSMKRSICNSWRDSTTEPVNEEFALGIDLESLHATNLMQMVYNTVVWHSGEFLKHMEISIFEKGR